MHQGKYYFILPLLDQNFANQHWSNIIKDYINVLFKKNLM